MCTLAGAPSHSGLSGGSGYRFDDANHGISLAEIKSFSFRSLMDYGSASVTANCCVRFL